MVEAGIGHDRDANSKGQILIFYFSFWAPWTALLPFDLCPTDN